MKFNSTRFGSITIEGVKCKYDIYYLPDGKIEKRDKSKSNRISGHKELARLELEHILKSDPKILLIGMGQSGVLPMSQSTIDWLDAYLNSNNVELYQKTTPELLGIANNLISQGKKFAGIFHTTC